MKRLYSRSKYKAQMYARQLRQLKSVRRKKLRPKKALAPKRSGIIFRAAAPINFSVINNPEAALRYLSYIKNVRQKYTLFVDMAETSVIGSDAIAVLAATIESDNLKGRVCGNWPEKLEARQVVFDSGFHRRVRTHYDQLTEKDLGLIAKREVYLDRIDTQVATNLARQLVDFARDKLCRDYDDKPSYGALIDVMENTFTHASPTRLTGQVSWFATVYCDMDRRKACYCFVDLGVGWQPPLLWR